MIQLELIGPDNWRLGGLQVAGGQKHFVAAPMALLARAYAYRERRSTALVIRSGGEPVGMALYYDGVGVDAFILSQFFIDERWQGRGFGLEAARQVLERMRQDGTFAKVLLCYVEGAEPARRMYEKLGFRPTGERDGDEIEMEKTL